MGGGELVVVAHHLMGKRSLKGQMLEMSNIFQLGVRGGELVVVAHPLVRRISFKGTDA